MRNFVIVLVLAGAGFLGYKYLYKRGAPEPVAASAQFMASCRQASAGVGQVEVYCACLASNGVKDMLSLATHPTSRAAVVTCQTQVGHVAPSAPPAPQPTPSGKYPPPTGRGRTADDLANQVQQAHKRHTP